MEFRACVQIFCILLLIFFSQADSRKRDQHRRRATIADGHTPGGKPDDNMLAFVDKIQQYLTADTNQEKQEHLHVLDMELYGRPNFRGTYLLNVISTTKTIPEAENKARILQVPMMTSTGFRTDGSADVNDLTVQRRGFFKQVTAVRIRKLSTGTHNLALTVKGGTEFICSGDLSVNQFDTSKPLHLKDHPLSFDFTGDVINDFALLKGFCVVCMAATSSTSELSGYTDTVTTSGDAERKLYKVYEGDTNSGEHDDRAFRRYLIRPSTAGYENKITLCPEDYQLQVLALDIAMDPSANPTQEVHSKYSAQNTYDDNPTATPTEEVPTQSYKLPEKSYEHHYICVGPSGVSFVLVQPDGPYTMDRSVGVRGEDVNAVISTFMTTRNIKPFNWINSLAQVPNSASLKAEMMETLNRPLCTSCADCCVSSDGTCIGEPRSYRVTDVDSDEEDRQIPQFSPRLGKHYGCAWIMRGVASKNRVPKIARVHCTPYMGCTVF